MILRFLVVSHQVQQLVVSILFLEILLFLLEHFCNIVFYICLLDSVFYIFMALFEFVNSFRGEVEGFVCRDNRFLGQNNGLIHRWINWLETLVYEDNLLLPELFFTSMSEKSCAFNNILFFKFLALILSLRHNYIILSCDLILPLIFDVVHL